MAERKEFDLSLQELKDSLIEMGGLVELALSNAVQALKNVESDVARGLIEKDIKINQIEERIETIGSKLIATQQPVAKDLRRILTAFKIANDLERMADLSVDIAKVVLRIEGQHLIKPLVDIPRMGEIVQGMIHDSIVAYVNEDVELAYKMAQTDDEVDQLYSQLFRELISFMMENPKTISQGMLLTFVGRYIERIADHATNIGESVVYLVTNERKDLN